MTTSEQRDTEQLQGLSAKADGNAITMTWRDELGGVIGAGIMQGDGAAHAATLLWGAQPMLEFVKLLAGEQDASLGAAEALERIQSYAKDMLEVHAAHHRRAQAELERAIVSTKNVTMDVAAADIPMINRIETALGKAATVLH